MSGLFDMLDALTRRRWSGDDVAAMVGPLVRAGVACAPDEEVREKAASGGAVTALLVDLLDKGAIAGALVCVTSVEDGRVRARYRVARTRADVLAAQGSAYVLGDFVGEALPLIEAHPGPLAVVALPCELTALVRRPDLARKVSLRIGLLCGHTSETGLIDAICDRLTAEAGGARLVGYRFRTGHWRGRLAATFEDGTVIEKPSGYFNDYQNLYYFAPKKCMYCGDHFAYDSDVSAGDLWSAKYKNDPVKRTALVVRTTAGEDAVRAAQSSGALDVTPVGVGEILDGQRRAAPFHFNVTARSRAGARLGIRIPEREGVRSRWWERAAARMALRAHVLTSTEEGARKVLAMSRRHIKARLYLLKALESLPPSPSPRDPVDRFAVIAGTVTGNRGAQVMLETTIGRLRDAFPDARFAVYSYYPERDRELVTDPRVTVHSCTPAYLVGVLFPLSLLASPFARGGGVPGIFPASVRDLAACRALADVAGVSFIDGREKFLPFNILTILPAMLLGVPVYKLSQAMGPFQNPLNRLASRILRRCALVVARGDVTLEHMRSIDFPPERLLEAPDTAFLFEQRDALSEEGAQEAEALCSRLSLEREAGRVVVGICPSAVIAGKAAKEGWDYTGFLADIVGGLLADGHAVLLFPNATRAGSAKLRNNDLPVIAAVTERLGGPDHLHAVMGDMGAAAIRDVVGLCDVTAVSRFHAMIGALAAGVPVAVLGWSHKYLEVMRRFGGEALVFDYAEHDAAAFLDVVRGLVRDRERYALAIAERMPEVRRASALQYERMREQLEASAVPDRGAKARSERGVDGRSRQRR